MNNLPLYEPILCRKTLIIQNFNKKGKDKETLIWKFGKKYKIIDANKFYEYLYVVESEHISHICDGKTILNHFLIGKSMRKFKLTLLNKKMKK